MNHAVNYEARSGPSQRTNALYLLLPRRPPVRHTASSTAASLALRRRRAAADPSRARPQGKWSPAARRNAWPGDASRFRESDRSATSAWYAASSLEQVSGRARRRRTVVAGDGQHPGSARRDAGRGVVVVLDVQDRPAFFDGLRGAPQRVVLWPSTSTFINGGKRGTFPSARISTDGNPRGYRPPRRVPPRQLLVSAPTGDGIVLVLVRVGPPVERPLDQRVGQPCGVSDVQRRD